jgi:hypothetical protein
LPAPLNRSTYKVYARSRAVTDFKELPGRVHDVVRQKGWEESADYALNWAVEAQTAKDTTRTTQHVF